MDNLKNFRRTNYCGDLRLGDTGKTVSLCGWVQRQRDLGGLIFVDLRDRTGLVQLSFDDGTDRAVFEKASSLRSEYVIAATGTVRERESKTGQDRHRRHRGICHRAAPAGQGGDPAL